MFAFKMLWIFLNIFQFTVIFCVKFENLQEIEIKDNFTTLEVEEASGENLGLDQTLVEENWEETNDNLINTTDFSNNLNDSEQIDTLNLNDSSLELPDEWITNESVFGTTEKYDFVLENSKYNFSNYDTGVLSRWLQEEKESLDFEDYDSEKLNDSNESPETFTAKPELNEKSVTTDPYKTINFENNGQILNLTVETFSDENETTPVSNHQNLSNSNVTDKKAKSDISRQYFGIIRNGEGIKCISFNFSFDVFFKDAHLSLPPIAYVEGNCDSSNNFIKFNWLDADKNGFNVITNFKIVCNKANCFVNSIDVEVEDVNIGEHFSASKENLHLFESKPGNVYKNATLIRLEMNDHLRISLSNVTFHVVKNLNSNELTLAQGAKFGDYYVETIASIVGFVVLISFTIYIIYILRKIKKSKGDFIPSST